MKNLQQSRSVQMSLSLLMRIIGSYFLKFTLAETFPYAQLTTTQSIPSTIEELQETHQLMFHFFRNLSTVNEVSQKIGQTLRRLNGNCRSTYFSGAEILNRIKFLTRLGGSTF